MSTAIIIALGLLLATWAVWYFFLWNRKWHLALKQTIHAIETGDVSRAKSFLRDAQDSVKKLSVDDPRALMVRLEEARLATMEDEYKQAIAILEDVLLSCAPDEKVGVLLAQGALPDQPKSKAHRNVFARALLNLAEAELCGNNATEAENLFKTAIRYREVTYGPVSQYVALALNRYAVFLADQGRMDEAKELYKRVEDMRRRY